MVGEADAAVRASVGRLAWRPRVAGDARFRRLLLLAALIGMTTSLTSPFIPIFVTRSLHATPSELGIFLFVTAGAAVVMNVVFGLASDHGVSQRGLLLTASAVGLAGALIYAVSRSYLLLLVVAGTLTACGSSLVPQIFTTARSLLGAAGGPRVRSRLAMLRAQFSIAWVAGPVAGAAVLAAWGYRGLFAAVGLTFAAVFLMCARRLGAVAPPSAPQQAGGVTAGPWRLLGMSGVFLALQTASGIGALALPLLITRDLRASTATVGAAFGTAAALEVPLMLALGWVTRRVSPWILLCAGAVSGSAYYAIVAEATRVWQVLAAQILSALFVAAVMGLGIGLFQDISPRRGGSATAWYINIIRISSMIAGPLVGYGQWVGNRAVLLAASFLCLLGLAGLALLMRKPGAREREYRERVSA
ncbi:MAG TPA: MFS transporter [Streptosporangiaceae bacterium]|jgi:SET family sugar efflux transporter-like MFS transporter